MPCRQVVGRKIYDIDDSVPADRASAFAATVLDIGTGEGRFVLESARAHPDRFHIGIDAAAENMAKASRTADARKTRLENALFLRLAAEQLPAGLAGLADQVSVHYPWGSLMRIVSQPEIGHLAKIAACCRTGARLSVLLNYSVFEDRDYLERLGMADIEDPGASETLEQDYAEAGFRIEHREIIAGDPDVRTAWGRHLVRGSSRRTLVIEASAVE